MCSSIPCPSVIFFFLRGFSFLHPKVYSGVCLSFYFYGRLAGYDIPHYFTALIFLLNYSFFFYKQHVPCVILRFFFVFNILQATTICSV